MELKTYFAQDAAGNLVPGATVTIFLQGTTTHATGLTKADGTALSNPFTADSAGRIQFRAPDGYYDMRVNVGYGGSQTVTIQCVDYSGAKADADRAEAAADRADVSAEQVADALALRSDLAEPGGGNIPGWYDAGSAVRASSQKTPSNTWQDAVNVARSISGADKPVVIGSDATNVETVAIQYALQSGVTGFHLTQGSLSSPTIDKRPIILLEKVCDSGDTDGPHTMANYSMSYVGGAKGAIPLSTYVEAKGTSAGGAIGIQSRARLQNATSSGWGGWSYIDVAGVLPVRAIGHEINVRCNLPAPLAWSASGGEVDGLVVASVDKGTNNMAHSAIKITKSTQGLGFLTGIRFAYRSIIPSDTSDLSVLNGEAILINGGSSNEERYGGIRIGANDGAGFTRFHYGLRTSEAQFNNNVAIWLGNNHRIRWGASLSSGPYLHYNATDFEMVGSALNISNGANSSIKTNGVKVLGQRVTGISQLSGTADGSLKNTETMTLVELCRYTKALSDAMSAHGLIGMT